MLRHYTLILSKTELHSPTMSRRHNIKPGILKHGTPRNSPEQLKITRNTSGTPRNNENTQNEEQL